MVKLGLLNLVRAVVIVGSLIRSLIMCFLFLISTTFYSGDKLTVLFSEPNPALPLRVYLDP